MKILVTGATGQLGREAVLAFGREGHDVTGIGRKELDLAGGGDVAAGIEAHRADWILNCAAYTQVDRAEQEPEAAFAVNRDAARAIAIGARRAGSRLLHLSTDFVFGGDQGRAYLETDNADPCSVYGQSKWQGEQAVREVDSHALILRTGWVYGVHGNNFVTTMLRRMAEMEEIRVVDDQIGTPTWTADIVRAMLVLMEQDAGGTYHFSNEGVASWYDLAQAIYAFATSSGGRVRTERVRPIPGSQWPCAARRPAFSVLNKEKIRPLLGYDIPHWRDSLQRMLRDMTS